jgi:dUTPase
VSTKRQHSNKRRRAKLNKYVNNKDVNDEEKGFGHTGRN